MFAPNLPDIVILFVHIVILLLLFLSTLQTRQSRCDSSLLNTHIFLLVFDRRCILWDKCVVLGYIKKSLLELETFQRLKQTLWFQTCLTFMIKHPLQFAWEQNQLPYLLLHHQHAPKKISYKVRADYRCIFASF